MFLELRNITKRFGSVVAVSNVSLDVVKGSFVCFVGPPAVERPPSSA